MGSEKITGCCPHCQNTFNVPLDLVGRRAKCNQCGQSFRIAPPDGVSAQPPTEAGQPPQPAASVPSPPTSTAAPVTPEATAPSALPRTPPDTTEETRLTPTLMLKSIVKGIDDDVRSAKSFVQTKLEVKRLSQEKRAAEGELNAIYGQIGARAEKIDLGPDLPAFREVVASRKKLTDAEAVLAQRKDAVSQAHEAQQAETNKHDNIIAVLETEQRRLSDNAAKAKSDLDSLNKQANKISGDITRFQMALDAYTNGTPQADPVETIKQRLETCQRDQAAIELRMASSREAFDKASAAVRSKDDELNVARQSWKLVKSQCKGALQLADAAEAQAGRDNEEARASLNATLQTFGRAIFDAGLGADQLAIEFQRVKTIQERISEIDHRSSRLQMEAAAKGSKVRQAALLGAGLALLCLCFFLWGWKGVVVCASAQLFLYIFMHTIKAYRMNRVRKQSRQEETTSSTTAADTPDRRTTMGADAPSSSRSTPPRDGGDGKPGCATPKVKPAGVPPKTKTGFTKRAFISHSSRDREWAQRICEVLESHGVTCWIAPRNIDPGAPYDEEILRGIACSQTFILLLSDASNASPHVKRELMVALRASHTVYPIRIQEVQPGPKLEYLLEGIHWVDAWTPPIEAHLERLAQLITKGPNADKPRSASGRNLTGGLQQKPRRRGRMVFVTSFLVLALLGAGWVASTWKDGVISGLVAYLTQQVDARVKGKPSAGPSEQTAENPKSNQREALLAQAARAVSYHEWQEAINAYESALVLSDDKETRAALARVVNARDQELAASKREDFPRLMTEAEQMDRGGNYENALTAYVRAAEAAPTDAERAQAKEGARKAGERVVHQKKKAEFEDFMRRANEAKVGKNWSGAMDWYDKAIAAAPEEASAAQALAAKSELVASRSKKVNQKLLLSCTNDPKMAKEHPSTNQVLDVAGDEVGELRLEIGFYKNTSALKFKYPSQTRESVLCEFRSDDPVGQTRVGKEEGVTFSCRLTEVKGESKQNGRIDVITVEVTATR